MPKLNAMNYTTANGEKKVNCYRMIIPKEIVKKAEFTEKDNLKARAEKGVIKIEKE